MLPIPSTTSVITDVGGYLRGVGRAVSCIYESVRVSVCPSVRAVEVIRLELSTPRSVLEIGHDLGIL